MATYPGLDREILNSITAFHSQFFSSIGADVGSLTSFLSMWSSFESKVQLCCDDLRQETKQKVYDFSSTVSSVIERILTTHSLCDELTKEVSTLLDDAVSTPLASSQKAISPAPAPYLRLASKWLVSNIHDPYPSQEIRKSMATQTRSSKKDVDNWFLDARKRVGWNDMRRKYFDNKRVGIVDAAKRFFLNADPSRPLPKAVESEFARVQMRARDIYSDKFEESPLAVQLDRSIVDITPTIKTRGHKSHKARTPSNTKAARSYPTPQPSPESSSSCLLLSPTPSLPELPITTSKRRASPSSESEEEHKRLSKRQRTFVDTGETSQTPSPTKAFSELPTTSSEGVPVILHELDEGDVHRPNSRRLPTLARETPPSLQLQRAVTFTSPGASLPSPAASTFDASELLPSQHHTDFNPYPASTLKRKRRLLDSEDSLPNSKRPQTSGMASHPQVAINPVPVIQNATTVDFQWDHLLDFSQFPPPVSDWSAEIAGPVDVSLFDFSVWDDFGNGASNFSQGSSAMSTNVVDTNVTGAPPPMNLADDNLLFNWDSYGPSYSPSQQSSSSGSGYLNLDGVRCNFTSLPNQLTTPTSLPTNFGCVPTFPVPVQPSLQDLSQPATEPAVTIPKPGLKAKEEQLRALQAQVAALAAEIAAS